jgi:hypothetical protein
VPAAVHSILARTGNREVSAVASRLVPPGGPGASLGQIDSAETPGSDESRKRPGVVGALLLGHQSSHQPSRPAAYPLRTTVATCLSLVSANRPCAAALGSRRSPIAGLAPRRAEPGSCLRRVGSGAPGRRPRRRRSYPPIHGDRNVAKGIGSRQEAARTKAIVVTAVDKRALLGGRSSAVPSPPVLLRRAAARGAVCRAPTAACANRSKTGSPSTAAAGSPGGPARRCVDDSGSVCIDLPLARAISSLPRTVNLLLVYNDVVSNLCDRVRTVGFQ